MPLPSLTDSVNSFDEDFSDAEEEFDKVIPHEPVKLLQPRTVQNRCSVIVINNKREEGYVNGFKRKPCFNLICKKCDVYVKYYKNMAWQSDVDYLFFRSYFGNFDKLKKKLIDKQGSMAFHCGCYGITISKTALLSEKGDIRWIGPWPQQ